MSGFDSNSLNYGLLFSLTMEEATGTAITGDAAKPHHTTQLTHSPAWVQLPSGVWVMDFDGANDYLQLAAASCVDLNFTSDAFSISMWIYPDNIGSRYLMSRGLINTDGWGIHLISGPIRFYSWQAGAQQISYTLGPIIISTWTLLTLSRPASASIVKFFLNGIEMTRTDSIISNPLTSARNFYIGMDNALTAATAYDGKLWNPRIWNRALSPEEVNWMFQRERWMFRV